MEHRKVDVGSGCSESTEREVCPSLLQGENLWFPYPTMSKPPPRCLRRTSGLIWWLSKRGHRLKVLMRARDTSLKTCGHDWTPSHAYSRLENTFRGANSRKMRAGYNLPHPAFPWSVLSFGKGCSGFISMWNHSFFVETQRLLWAGYSGASGARGRAPGMWGYPVFLKKEG